MADSRRLAAVSGAVSAVGTPTSIVVLTLVAPWFSWARNAFSDLGVTAGTALAFNATVVLGGLLALPFAWLLWTVAEESGGLLRAGLFAVSGVALSAVGLFPSGDPLHVPVAVTHFVGVTATLAVDAVVRRGERTGQAAALAALVHVGGWVAWGAGVLPPGLAIPEFVGAVVLASWVLVLSPTGFLQPRPDTRRDRH